ncbi:tyrosine-type recombinase/integrase [Curtobacterium flaccumfaciens]|uniref:tyrosine-type recombinase/integrase n=1 Tax=Curtobacterium flaccumfaciens TaxID=2035 RepID=UPI001BDEE65B|nr:tyrosine-type recombinase/integrase [Curtobacterium flaccumfaciens]MBT1632367.1 tyrosine-type recombinase/integrase [Curtobacterium flaccumfaciens pv. oortii]MCX2844993.1 tyrosine-type recombinase/integrase [Curtobacterium flaccumfaciens pv. oortii]
MRDILFEAGIITQEQCGPGSDVPSTRWARHTTATVLMELGVDAKFIGEIVGHQSEAVTRRYHHVSSAAARDAMDKLGSHSVPGRIARPMAVYLDRGGHAGLQRLDWLMHTHHMSRQRGRAW